MILKNNKRIDGCSDTVPIGTLNPFLGTTAPYGYLICQGQKVSKTTYKELYEICGTTFGPETSDEFTLPDLRGQTIAGYKEGDSTFGTLGGLIGSLTHLHSTGNHTLTAAELPQMIFDISHTCYAERVIAGIKNVSVAQNGGTQAGWEGAATTIDGNRYAHRFTIGNDGTHNHGDTSSTSSVQPTIVLNWIVKAFQLMPNQSYVENSLESDSTINSLSAAKGKELNEKINGLSEVSISGSYSDLKNKPTSIVYQNTLTSAISSLNINNLNLIGDGYIYDIIITVPNGNTKMDLRTYVNGIKEEVYQTVVGMNVQTEASSNSTAVTATSPCARLNNSSGIYYGFSQNGGPSLIQGTLVMAGQYVMCNYTGTAINSKKVYYIQASCTCMKAVNNLTSLLIEGSMIPGTQITITKRAW
jgi:microcystin-dependent protein